MMKQRKMIVGTTWTSTIDYYLDYGSPLGEVIKVGAIGEIIKGDLNALFLIARAQLTGDELAMLGYFGRLSLAKPFDYLMGIVQETWYASTPGESLLNLAESNPGSLHISKADELDVTNQELVEFQSYIQRSGSTKGLDSALLCLVDEVNLLWFSSQYSEDPIAHKRLQRPANIAA